MIRKVVTGLIAFKLKNVKEIQPIFDESVVRLTDDHFIDILKYVYRSCSIFYISIWTNPGMTCTTGISLN
jgi:hypothetical protein